MKRIISLSLIIISFLLGCGKELPFQTNNQESDIKMQIEFQADPLESIFSRLISGDLRVYVIVTGAGFSAITKELDLNWTTRTATGRVEVPKGNARKFRVEGRTDNNTVIFSGEKTINIRGDMENVTIPVQWNTANVHEIKYDDGSFEEEFPGDEQNQSMLVYFTPTSVPTKLLAAKYYIKGTETFHVTVWDENGTLVSSRQASGSSSEEWITVDLIDLNITLSGSFYLGLTYSGAMDSHDLVWYPEIGFDETSPSGRSYVNYESAGLFPVNYFGYQGNFGIRAVVQDLSTGKIVELNP